MPPPTLMTLSYYVATSLWPISNQGRAETRDHSGDIIHDLGTELSRPTRYTPTPPFVLEATRRKR